MPDHRHSSRRVDYSMSVGEDRDNDGDGDGDGTMRGQHVVAVQRGGHPRYNDSASFYHRLLPEGAVKASRPKATPTQYNSQ